MPPAGPLHFLQGNYVRVRRGGWTSPPSPPDSGGKWGSCRFHSTVVRPGITHQYESHQSCRTWATWSRKHSHSDRHHWVLTPHSLGWGVERLQNTETVLPAQVCAKPHTPDDHRSGEGMLHFNISKRHCLFLESLCHVHTTLASFTILLCTYNTFQWKKKKNTFQCKSKWTAKHSIYINVRILQRIKAW